MLPHNVHCMTVATSWSEFVFYLSASLLGSFLLNNLQVIWPRPSLKSTVEMAGPPIYRLPKCYRHCTDKAQLVLGKTAVCIQFIIT